MLPWHQYLFGLLFIIAGANHFRIPKIYARIMPPYIPSKNLWVMLSGIAEMIAGLILLNPETQVIAAWAIIGMLVLFIPVHIFMLQDEKASLKLPKWVLYIRIPLQLVLIYWVYLYVV
jgi:uncharacterized membrane protein